MNEVLEEKDYQKYLLERLAENGYKIRSAKKYCRQTALDEEMLFRFLEATQPEKMTELRKIYKGSLEDTILGVIGNEETRSKGSRLEVLKKGVDINHIHLDLMYTRPATDYNTELLNKYRSNIFSAAEEVWASDEERVDVVLFLNGFAIMTFELKSNAAGQSYLDAIAQYREERNPKTRLFQWKSGALVCFAMDLELVFMTTKLDKAATFFLPFNMGNGTGIDAGAGNPLFKDKYSVCYMWEEILQKDSVLEIISKFMFIEKKKDDDTGKVKETVIFPRFHQLDVIRKLLAAVVETGTSQNYLLQHSAGSGKTNEIAWLAHRLSSLHDAKNKQIYDNIVIVTDRVVVDRQLQDAVMGIEHKSGLVRVMDDKCTSSDLKDSLSGNTKIIATTIQKFPYILESVKGLNKKTFAVIIDEAHSSTAGKNMQAVTKALGAGEQEAYADAEDMIADEVRRIGKQSNVSMFAFTATPKPTTLQLFGRLNTKGQREAFHIYSMKQAIEEGFIIDVLQSYITYDTYFRLNKSIEDDPELKTNEAKRQIARFIQLHDTNIAQRVEVIVEHFRNSVMQELEGQAKAMVITESRQGAVKYRQAFDDYVARKGYTGIRALVAFSGKVKLPNEDKEYTEVGMNGFPEKRLPKEFDKDEYQVLLVADKYQTGFDQKKLCAMYILKKLHGVSVVQTLSRLNRICPPYEKKTFILDFANDYEEIEKAFSRYYTTTLLTNSVTPSSVYELEVKIDSYYFLSSSDVEDFNTILYKKEKTVQDRKHMVFYLQKAKKYIQQTYDKQKQEEISKAIRRFVRLYEFLIQASCFEDAELHKKYNFLSYLGSFMKTRHEGGGFNLDGKLKASGFAQKKNKEHTKPKITPNPTVRLPEAEGAGGASDPKKERLSQIIEEINSRMGKAFDGDVVIKSLFQMRDLLMKSEALKRSAQNNTERDFEFAFYKSIDDVLVQGLEQNQDFYTTLLNNEELKKEVLGIFVSEIYSGLRDRAKTFVYPEVEEEVQMAADEDE